jgi:hypothetical protein
MLSAIRELVKFLNMGFSVSDFENLFFRYSCKLVPQSGWRSVYCRPSWPAWRPLAQVFNSSVLSTPVIVRVLSVGLGLTGVVEGGVVPTM